MFYDFFGNFQQPRNGCVAFHLSFHFSTCVPLVFHLCSTCVPPVFYFCSFVFILCSFVFICVHLCSFVFYLCSICVHLCSFVFLLVWCFRLDQI